MKKGMTFTFFFLFLASAVFSQSLTEIAKKEKERRESLKGKKTAVVTNADLAKLRKEPAIQMAVVEIKADLGQTPPAEIPPADQTPAPPPPQAKQEQEAVKKDVYSSVTASNPKRAQEKWDLARERVDLLTMKMNALWQQFYSLDNMMPRDEIQKQISETYAKLLQAQEEETRVREELQKALSPIKS